MFGILFEYSPAKFAILGGKSALRAAPLRGAKTGVCPHRLKGPKHESIRDCLWARSDACAIEELEAMPRLVWPQETSEALLGHIHPQMQTQVRIFGAPEHTL